MCSTLRPGQWLRSASRVGPHCFRHALFPSVCFCTPTGCRGRRRRQPVVAGHSGCDAWIVALAIAANPGEPDRGASSNNNPLRVFRVLPLNPPSKAFAHRKRFAQLITPRAQFYVRRGARAVLSCWGSRTTGWSLVGQLGAFASRRRSVKNWMHAQRHDDIQAWGEGGMCALGSALLDQHVVGSMRFIALPRS